MSTNMKKLLLQFGVLVTIWLIAFWQALSSAVDVWASSETYKHCFFILPIVLYLIYERKAELRTIDFKPNYWLMIGLAAAYILNLGADLLGLNLINHGAAYIGIVSIVWLVFGNQFFKQFWFPLLFLGFAIPFGEELVPVLQDITAFLTVELVRLVGIPIYRDGLYLYVPNGTFLVAEACAGIRFLIAALALGTLFAYLNYKTKWKFYGFILISILVPIIANGIRAFGIVAIGYSTDMEHAVGADHLVYGWFFFAFVLALLFGLGQIGRENTLIKVDENAPAGKAITLSSPAWVFAIVISVALPVYNKILSTYEKVDATVYLHTKLSNVSNIAKQEFDWQPMLFGPHETWSGRIDSVPMYIAYYQADNQEHELISGLDRYFNIDIYTRKSFEIVDTEFGRVYRVELVDVSGKNVTLHYWFSVDGVRTAKALNTKLNQVKSKLDGRRGEGFFIAVAVDTLSKEVSQNIHLQIETR